MMKTSNAGVQSSGVILYLICILSSLFDIFSFRNCHTLRHAPLQHSKSLNTSKTCEKIPKIQYFLTY